jgi:acetyl-CoA decarbonylase/synthase complex subunit gamma
MERPEKAVSIEASCCQPEPTDGAAVTAKSYIIGYVPTKVGKIPRVGTEMSRADKWGAIRARWTINRMRYTVEPGLYAVGSPDGDSIVLVSSNYKLSFDLLRRELDGIDAWIVVLNTKGINVWCAAGKGTFGTEEIVKRIRLTGLEKVVAHRRLILPQLGAPGVAAHEVKKLSGFDVTYGPIRSKDIPAFLHAGMVATPRMRQVGFSFSDRLTLVPAELTGWFGYLGVVVAAFLALGGLSSNGYSGSVAMASIVPSLLGLLLAYVAGTVASPLLLPWLPGRAFSLKGVWPGIGLALLALLLVSADRGLLEVSAWMLIVPAISSFLAMNFTGSSTYTSLSGVKKEMKIAVPSQITAFVIGTVLWVWA